MTHQNMTPMRRSSDIARIAAEAVRDGTRDRTATRATEVAKPDLHKQLEKKIMQTRKYSRTLNEAFGPYTSNTISEPDRPMDWQDKLVLAGCALATVFIGFIMWGE